MHVRTLGFGISVGAVDPCVHLQQIAVVQSRILVSACAHLIRPPLLSIGRPGRVRDFTCAIDEASYLNRATTIYIICTR
jgi:hypothetical protein